MAASDRAFGRVQRLVLQKRPFGCRGVASRWPFHNFQCRIWLPNLVFAMFELPKLFILSSTCWLWSGKNVAGTNFGACCKNDAQRLALHASFGLLECLAEATTCVKFAECHVPGCFHLACLHGLRANER